MVDAVFEVVYLRDVLILNIILPSMVQTHIVYHVSNYLEHVLINGTEADAYRMGGAGCLSHAHDSAFLLFLVILLRVQL